MNHKPALSRCTLAALAALLVACAQRPVPIHHVRPADPTRVLLGDQEYKQERKTWFQERHRAPPDVDWEMVERGNGERQRTKRNRLATMAAAASSRWIERGSNNLAGRMHVAVPSPDGTLLYAGSSLGGIWRGTPDGQGWTPLGDNIHGGAHWLAVVPGVGPSDPDIILRGTDGGQVHRSTDDGATWLAPAGLPATVGVRRILTTADGNHTIFAVVQWWQGATLRNGVYRSTDRGASFVQVRDLVTFPGDIWTPRTAAGPLYLVRQDKLEVSFDDGDSWSIAGTLPMFANDAELCGSEAGAPRLWAILNEAGTNRLYRSDDAGGSFSYVTDVSDYWGTLNASITDPDLFAWGGVEVHRTANGGGSFAIVNPWWEYYGQEADRLHADVPGMDVVPDGGGGEIWYISTDGGLYHSLDGLASVQNLSLSGLRVSQYYSTLTSTVVPDNVLGGSQDQGYQRADLPPSAPDTTLAFDQLISGDYGHLTSRTGSHAWVYSVYPGFVLIHRKENAPDLYQTDFPAGENHGWMPFIMADPYSDQAFFFCATHLWRYTKAALGFNYNAAQWSSHDFEGTSGEYLTAVAFSPVDPERAYAATNYGRLFWSNDHGVSWTESTSTGPGAHYFYGTAIVPSAADVDEVLVGGSGYGVPGVRRSTDGGQTWQAFDAGLPDTLVYDLAQAPDGTYFAATETAAYQHDGAAWVDITANDAPVTIYWSVETVASQNVMRFGTYGRGMWDYDLTDPCLYQTYGVGAGGANVLTLDVTATTNLGQVHDYLVTGGPPSAPGYLLFALASANLPLKKGTLLVDPNAMALIGVVADGSGSVAMPFNMPSNPLLIGVTPYLQVVLQDPAQQAGWAFSNGLTGTWCE